jgi:hypothetical protein
MARRSSVNTTGHPVRPHDFGNITRDDRGVWTVTLDRPKTSARFIRVKRTDKSIRVNAVRNAHESRSNRCGRCFTQRSLAGECMC